MQTLKKQWTDDELLCLPDDGNKYELVDGELVVSPTGFRHGNIAARLVAALGAVVSERALGFVADSSTGFKMKGGNVRSPDISFVAKERLRGMKQLPEKFFEGAPDLAVEVLSPGDTVEGVHGKIVEYFENGTLLAWVINSEEETVLIHHGPGPDKLLRAGEMLEVEQVVPGFELPVANLFAVLPWAEE